MEIGSESTTVAIRNISENCLYNPKNYLLRINKNEI